MNIAIYSAWFLADEERWLLGNFRLDHEFGNEYEYDFRVQTSDVSRALALHVGFRQRG